MPYRRKEKKGTFLLPIPNTVHMLQNRDGRAKVGDMNTITLQTENKKNKIKHATGTAFICILNAGEQSKCRP